MFHYCQTRQFKRVKKNAKRMLRSWSTYHAKNSVIIFCDATIRAAGLRRHRFHHQAPSSPRPPTPVPVSSSCPGQPRDGISLWAAGAGVREQRWGKERSHKMRRQRVSDLAPARGREEKEGGVDPESGGRWAVGFACSVFRSVFLAPEFVLVFLRHSSPAIFLRRFAISSSRMTIFCARSLNLSSKLIQQRHIFLLDSLLL